MARTEPRKMFGVHELTFYNRLNGIPYGDLRVLAGATINLTGEVVTLPGGSNKFIWDAQDGLITSELNFKPREFPAYLFYLLLGKEPTELTDDAGNTANFANVKNATVFDAATGIATVGVKSGSEADLKFSKYVTIATGAAAVDVYTLSTGDLQRGADKVPENDLLKITASPLTITTGAAVEVPGYGIELTGGSGTIALVTGDTAEFEVNPPSFTQMDVVIGAQGDCIPEFGALVTTQKQSDGSYWIFDCYKCKALGFPFGAEEKAYNEADITAHIIYDAVKNGAIKARWMRPSAGCA